jgi:hypothetical protein
MLVVPASRRMVMTRLRRLAVMRRPLAVRTWERARAGPRARSALPGYSAIKKDLTDPLVAGPLGVN